MKALTVCPNTTTGVANGRISKNRDSENAEIQLYLSKLKDLVPSMPKNRKISKLEVIQYVIDYICDLQNALDTNPDVDSFDASQAIAGENLLSEQQAIQTPASPRQPLVVRSSPNLIVSATNHISQPQHLNNSSNHSTSNSESSAPISPNITHTISEKSS
jgi:DNA-binding protein inhibitor ID